MLTTKEAAGYLGISPSTIYRMEKRALIKSTRIPDGKRRFNKKDLDLYLQKSCKFEPPQNPSIYKKQHLHIKEPPDIYVTKNEEIKRNLEIQPLDELFFHQDSIWIYNTDILKTESIKEGSIDLVITSPPYNVDIQYTSHNDTMSYEDYLSFTRDWLQRCYRFLKDDGRFCLNIPLDKNKGGQQSVCADITTLAKQIGFKYHSTIIWNEQNISRRTAWGSWLSASAPYGRGYSCSLQKRMGKNEWNSKIGYNKKGIYRMDKRCMEFQWRK